MYIFIPEIDITRVVQEIMCHKQKKCARWIWRKKKDNIIHLLLPTRQPLTTQQLSRLFLLYYK